MFSLCKRELHNIKDKTNSFVYYLSIAAGERKSHPLADEFEGDLWVLLHASVLELEELVCARTGVSTKVELPRRGANGAGGPALAPDVRISG